MSMELYATARQMLADLRTGKISARELLDAHVARHEALAGRLNIVIDTDLGRARADADAIDAARKRGDALGPLAGLPMTIKDGFDVEAMPAVVGHPGLVGRPKTCADAAVVARARADGAVIWGKTNVPLLLGDLQTFNTVYGTTNNPYDVARTPGGSSGGSAAALATGITPLEIGSDIGGSLRHPANFCGVFSLKPTWGTLPQRGHIPPLPDRWFEPDFNVVGPMARNAEDLRLLYASMSAAGPGARRGIRGARVAIWNEEAGVPLDPAVKAATERAGKALADLGVHVEHAKPDIDGQEMMRTYLAMLSAVVSANLPDEAFAEFQSHGESDRAELARGADWTSPSAYRANTTALYRDVTLHMARRQAMKDRLAAFYTQGWDAILMPITPTTAFPHSQAESFAERRIEIGGKIWPFMSMISWIAPATFLHAPAAAIPAGQIDGLPVGVQMVGRWGGEDRLFDFAAALEEAMGGFTPPPDLA